MHRDEHCEKMRARYTANKEHHNSWMREYRERGGAALREKTNAQIRAWVEANPERRKVHTKKWDSQNRDKKRAVLWRYRAQKAGNGGTITPAEWEALKAVCGYRCLRCLAKEPDIKLHLDHVVAISRGGGNTLRNAQPLCARCNVQKSAHSWDYRYADEAVRAAELAAAA